MACSWASETAMGSSECSFPVPIPKSPIYPDSGGWCPDVPFECTGSSHAVHGDGYVRAAMASGSSASGYGSVAMAAGTATREAPPGAASRRIGPEIAIDPERLPSVSVLIPIYNVERYIASALDSLQAQTFGDFEAICINDGSRDSSRKILQRYLDSDSRFRVIDKPNSGYGASINVGIAHARGRYIAILEPDDFYEPDALEKLMKVADSTNADVVKGDYWFYWSKPAGRDSRPKEKRVCAHVISEEMTGHVFNAWTYPQIFFCNPSVWSAIYKRSFLRGNGLKMLETPGASFQDLGFTFKVWALAQRVVCIGDPVLSYRQDNEQSSVNDPGKAFCVCDEFDSMEDFVDAVPKRAALRPYLFRLRYDSYMWNFERLSSDLRARFVKTMSGDFARCINRGDYVLSLFAYYQQRNLQLVVEDPKRFLERFPEKPGRIGKAWYYFRIGGPKALLSAARK